MGGTRGRRLNQEIKQACLDLSKEAQESGCRLKIVCQDLGVDLKTINRWESSIEDQRRGPLTKPANKLSDAERDLIIKTATSKEYQDQSPWYIVPSLADQGIYLASEATFYRVLKQESLLAHRRRSKKPSHKKPKPLTAKAPNQVWSWDISVPQQAMQRMRVGPSQSICRDRLQTTVSGEGQNLRRERYRKGES